MLWCFSSKRKQITTQASYRQLESFISYMGQESIFKFMDTMRTSSRIIWRDPQVFHAEEWINHQAISCSKKCETISVLVNKHPWVFACPVRFTQIDKLLVYLSSVVYACWEGYHRELQLHSLCNYKPQESELTSVPTEPMEIYFLDMSRETLNITSLPLPITQIKLACRLFRFSRLQKKQKQKQKRGKEAAQTKKKKGSSSDNLTSMHMLSYFVRIG